ncbi:MAG: anaerobic sulfatase maturase [Candidatus Aminicenantes bacterium]
MTAVKRSFQVFVKPVGAACNLGCRYCYYLEKEVPGPESGPRRMPLDLLEEVIAQHFAASPPDEVVRFSWHGGEPTLAGLDFFRRAVSLQRKHLPPGRSFTNGLQTNGTLLDDEWGRFLAAEGFAVGLSLDGPREIHDLRRVTRDGHSTFDRALRGYEALRRHAVTIDILCVVGAHNAGRPADVYRFFKGIGAAFVTFLPLVERRAAAPSGASPDSVAAEAWGEFLCAVFDEWVSGDIGRVKVQIFEEAIRTAFGLEHSLCVFRPVCGDVPVVERDGSFFSCDHFVNPAHRLGSIRETPLAELLESAPQRAFGRRKLETLPRVCRECDVLEMCHGECPKNRFARTPDGEVGLNDLCAGYKRVFRHCRPFVEAVGAEWRQSTAAAPPRK